MPLDRAAAAERVDTWSAALASPWSEREKDEVAGRLQDLAAVLVPHVVEDRPIDADRLQAFLVRRTVARLEDWLTVAVARQRTALGLEALRLEPATDRPALGLRSAERAEIDALPGVGPTLTDRLRRHLASRPSSSRFDDLIEVHGLGSERLELLRAKSYLDEPRLGLVSPTTWALLLSPTVPHLLALFERGDTLLLFGDHTAYARRLPAEAPSAFLRFLAFVDLVVDRARLAASGSAGWLASDADRWLARHERREALLATAVGARGALLVSDAYVPAARAKIAAAERSIRLMMFVGHARAGEGGEQILPLVEELEAVAVRGVDVRVVLDQDDGGEPYRSFFINRPLVERLRGGPIQVKWDTPETLLHSKLLVLDDAACIVGSHNWTQAGFTRTHELSVLLESPEAAAGFGRRFDALWERLPALDPR